MEYPALIHGLTELLSASSSQLFLEAQCAGARRLAQEGRHAEAISAYQDVLKRFNQYPDVWQELAGVQRSLGDLEAARASLLEVIRLDPWRTRAHSELGAIGHSADWPADLLSNYLSAIGAPGATMASAEAAIRDSLRQLALEEHYLRLAHLQIAGRDVDDALETLTAAVSAGFESPALAGTLAETYAFVGQQRESRIWTAHWRYLKLDYDVAVSLYEEILSAGVAGPLVYARLGSAYAALQKWPQAIDACRRGIAVYPDDQSLAVLLVHFLQTDGQLDASIREAAAWSHRFPDNPRLLQQALLSLPIVYETAGEVSRCRVAYTAGLEQLRRLLPSSLSEPVDPLHRLGPSFHLAYQARDDKALQTELGTLLHASARARFPQWCSPMPMPAHSPGERVRVGYVSAHLYRHTVAKLFLGWLQEHDASRFETFVYYTGHRVDPMTQQFESSAAHFYHAPSPAEHIAPQIAKDRLHVLVYLDVGMDDATTELAATYLAPVQCAAWGHPVTTGLPTIAYFLSSELMEPEGGAGHYSETLVRLPGIGVNVPPPHLDPHRRSRSDFGFADADCVYLTPQSTFKYLPQYDDVFCRIAKQVPAARFVFLRSGSSNVTDLLKGRLLAAFERHGLDGNRFLVFLPPLSHRDFLELNRTADLFLDQPGWSGGITALEAIGCGLPVATCPGAFMRGRHSYAFLKQMGLDSLIAPTLDEFVALAIRLGTDTEWREEMKSAIAERRHLLFNDVSCVRALEEFYSSTVLRRQTR